MFFRRSISTLHWAMKWTVVSSSSWQKGQMESWCRPITWRCRLRFVWPVSRPTRILKSFLGRFRVKRARERSSSWRKSLACLHSDSSCHSLFCSCTAHELTQLQMVETLIPTDGSGSAKQEEEASLVSIFTFSLPAIPLCPGTQVSLTLLKVANAISAVIASATKPVVALLAETAFVAASCRSRLQ